MKTKKELTSVLIKNTAMKKTFKEPSNTTTALLDKMTMRMDILLAAMTRMDKKYTHRANCLIMGIG